MGKERIRLVNVSKSYYSKESVTQALRKVNLSFFTGEFVAITGESGSGKSTLLRMIGGMDTFDEGEMFIDNQPTFQYDEADWEEYRCHRIGYVFQDYSLLGHYTVLDNIVGALLVMGVEREVATKRAYKYLEQVGLAGLEHHKAVELSSGQKQRLSIARALSKETGIIIADEPTGNLDTETGAQIIQLLAQLSKDRLVIMVTHNYDQVEAYVNRKIRIHDGEVISDVAVQPMEESDDAEQELEQTLRLDKKTIVKFFTKRNLLTQFARTAMLGVFTLVVAVVAFLLIGELSSHWDDTYTKKYSKAAFPREDDTRIVVKKQDQSAFTEAEIEKLMDMKYVESVDSCDYSNDVNYYFEQDKDYKLIYGRGGWNSESELQSVKFLDDSKFMRSLDGIEASMLTDGRMPESRREIVLATDNEKMLNKTFNFYFTCTNFWGSDYFTGKFKVVGIIKSDYTQAYFTQEFSNMLTSGIWDYESRIAYGWNSLLKDYDYKPEIYPVISDSLKGNHVRVATKFPMSMIPREEILFWTMKDGEVDKEETIYVDAVLSDSTGLFMEVSQEFYDAHFTPQNKQLSIYIVSYGKTDAVLRELEKMGYYAVSTIRVSKTDYQEQAVKERLTLMGICFAGLIVLLLAQVLILRALMRSRIKDYDIMRFIGMKISEIKKNSHLEMITLSLLATVITIVGMNLFRWSDLAILKDMMWYYYPGTYALFVLYVNISMFLTVVSFNGSLKGRLHS